MQNSIRDIQGATVEISADDQCSSGPITPATLVLNLLLTLVRGRPPQFRDTWEETPPPWTRWAGKRIRGAYLWFVRQLQVCGGRNILDAALADVPMKPAERAELKTKISRYMHRRASQALLSGLLVSAARLAFVVAIFITLIERSSFWAAVGAYVLGVLLDSLVTVVNISLISSAIQVRLAWQALVFGVSLGITYHYFASGRTGLVWSTLLLASAVLIFSTVVDVVAAIWRAAGRSEAVDLEAEVCHRMLYLHHFALLHRDTWGEPTLVREIDRRRIGLSRIVRQNLPARISPSDRTRRRSLEPVAQSVSQVLIGPHDLLAEAGRKEMLTSHRELTLKVSRSEWMAISTASPTPRDGLARREFQLSAHCPRAGGSLLGAATDRGRSHSHYHILCVVCGV